MTKSEQRAMTTEVWLLLVFGFGFLGESERESERDRQKLDQRIRKEIRKRSERDRQKLEKLAIADHVFEAEDPAGVPQNEGPSLRKCSWSPPMRGSAQHETFRDHRQGGDASLDATGQLATGCTDCRATSPSRYFTAKALLPAAARTNGRTSSRNQNASERVRQKLDQSRRIRKGQAEARKISHRRSCI